MDITNKKILVCDDSVLARKQLIDAVNEVSSGATFLEAKNGAEAVDVYKKENQNLYLWILLCLKKMALRLSKK